MDKLKLIALVAGAAALLVAGPEVVMAQKSLGAMAKAGATDLAKIPGLLAVLMYIAGAVLIFAGIVKFKQVSNAGGRDGRLGGAITTVLVGVALIALPAVYQGIATTFGVAGPAKIARPSLE